MIRRSAFRTFVLGALASTLALIGAAQAEDAFDLSPQQAGRVHAERNEAAIAAIAKDFTFVSSGKFTVAVSPGGPPLATYAMDAQTVVGADPAATQSLPRSTAV